MSFVAGVTYFGECIVGQDVMKSEEEELLCILRQNVNSRSLEYVSGVLVQHFERVASTQQEARNLVSAISPKEWVVLSAEEQTEGVGTHGRPWVSPKGDNLYATFVIPFFQEESEKLFFISQTVAVAICRTLKQFDLNPKIKWPNDVMLNKKKVAGILCETSVPPNKEEPYLLSIGIGLNIHMERSLCERIDQPVTSLSLEADRTFDKNEILSMLIHHLKACIDELHYCGFSGLLQEVNPLLASRGEKVTVEREFLPPVHGIFVGVDTMGRLILRPDEGEDVILDQGRIRR